MFRWYRKYRLWKSFRGCIKATKRLEKARAERIWIENNPHIHILNYPFYKLIRIINPYNKE